MFGQNYPQYPEGWTPSTTNFVLQEIIIRPQLKSDGENVQQRGQKPPVNDVKPFLSAVSS